MGDDILPGKIDVRLVERLPTPDEYNAMRMAVGWEPIAGESTRQGLSRSLWCLVAEWNGRPVGMARIIGDGAIYVYFQDVMVLPEFQRQGIGSRLMEAALDWLRRHCPPDGMVALFAAPGAASFYERYGFEPRPPDSPGMELPWPLD
jgi:GNAT superfamily N-acetyltransferase